MSPSAQMITTLNIDRYRNLLKTERDPIKRHKILTLLAEEEVKLADFASSPEPIASTRPG